MKRLNTICTMATLLLAGVSTIVSCTKDDEQPVEGKTYHMTVTASKGGDNAKALTDDGTTISATWAQGETVTVYNVTKNADLTGTLSAQSSGDNTTLKGDLTGTIEEGDELLLKFCSPDYSMQEGTLAYIAANCDYAEATVTVASVEGGEIAATAAAAFVNKQAIVKFSLMDAGGTAINASALSVSVGGTIYAAVPASATNELYVALPGISGKQVTLSAKVGGQWYNKTQEGVTFVNGQYYTVAAKLAQKGMLPGTFSVGGGKKVHFSQGNLKYTNGIWSFHTNQYDYLGVIGQNMTTDNIDLFGWVGASSTVLTSAPDVYGVSTSVTPDDYGTSSSDTLKADWANLAISNGGNMENSGWHTLTSGDNNSAEWKYLFNTRTASTVGGTLNGRYAKATVADKSGVILFPDVYTHPAGVDAPASVDISDAEFTVNNYAPAVWAKMEAAGAVFLPAAGRRVGSTVDQDGIGRYWSSTPGSLPYARIASFSSDYVSPADNNRRFRGFSVRLVCPVE